MSRARTLPVLLAIGFLVTGCASSPQVAGNHRGKFHVGRPNYTVSPYQVNGVWYYPRVDYSYDETGTASWYGEQFNERPTSDGEIFDMNQLSAAHKTLPLPSVVDVTNLQNGRELRLRVNDRGPFVDGRLIDLSRRAAQLLGFERSGTAPVRMTAAAVPAPPPAIEARSEPPPARPAYAAAPRRYWPSLIASAHAETLHLSRSPAHHPAPIAVRNPRGIFIQAGAFSVLQNAERVRARIATLGSVEVVPTAGSGGALYRVRLGPLASDAEAVRLLSKVVDRGYPGARVVAE